MANKVEYIDVKVISYIRIKYNEPVDLERIEEIIATKCDDSHFPLINEMEDFDCEVENLTEGEELYSVNANCGVATITAFDEDGMELCNNVKY